MFLTTALYLILFAAIILAFSFVMNAFLKTKGHEGPVTDHFDGKRFHSYGFKNGEQQFPDLIPDSEIDNGPQPQNMIGWMFRRSKSKWEYRKANKSNPLERVEGDRLVVTYINHATVLIQTQGLNILTDPVWSERASPFSWIGPKRYQDPGIDLDALPQIDIVLLSHNHYDHMDLYSLKRLHVKFSPKIYTSLGNSHYLNSKGITGAIDMDWWDSLKVNEEITISSVPSQHFSARAISDRNKTLWCGFVLESQKGHVYFAGDTGFGPWVDKVAEKYPQGFRFGILPIGAFKPRSFMKEVHVAPVEAVKIREVLKVNKAMAIHFGTFKLADDKQDEPVEALQASLKAFGQSDFFTLRNGETLEI